MMPTEMFGPNAMARSRASGSSTFWRLASSVSLMTGASLTVASAASEACGARSGIGFCRFVAGTGVRRQERHRLAQFRHGNGFGLLGIIEADLLLLDHAVEHAVTRFARRIGIAIEPAGLRRLRQRDQQRGFSQRQPLRLLAEIGDRGGANALEVAAVRREREIEVENLLLAQAALDLDRTHHLPQLCMERTL